MQVLTGTAALGLCAFGVLAVLHGLANTIDALALALHRAACNLRDLQERRTAVVSEAWVRCIEK